MEDHADSSKEWIGFLNADASIGRRGCGTCGGSSTHCHIVSAHICFVIASRGIEGEKKIVAEHLYRKDSFF